MKKLLKIFLIAVAVLIGLYLLFNIVFVICFSGMFLDAMQAG